MNYSLGESRQGCSRPARVSARVFSSAIAAKVPIPVQSNPALVVLETTYLHRSLNSSKNPALINGLERVRFVYCMPRLASMSSATEPGRNYQRQH
jgi:hypothetical protein